MGDKKQNTHEIEIDTNLINTKSIERCFFGLHISILNQIKSFKDKCNTALDKAIGAEDFEAVKKHSQEIADYVDEILSLIKNNSDSYGSKRVFLIEQVEVLNRSTNTDIGNRALGTSGKIHAGIGDRVTNKVGQRNLMKQLLNSKINYGIVDFKKYLSVQKDSFGKLPQGISSLEKDIDGFLKDTGTQLFQEGITDMSKEKTYDAHHTAMMQVFSDFEKFTTSFQSKAVLSESDVGVLRNIAIPAYQSLCTFYDSLLSFLDDTNIENHPFHASFIHDVKNTITGAERSLIGLYSKLIKQEPINFEIYKRYLDSNVFLDSIQEFIYLWNANTYLLNSEFSQKHIGVLDAQLFIKNMQDILEARKGNQISIIWSGVPEDIGNIKVQEGIIYALISNCRENARNHGSAKQVNIDVSVQEGFLQLEVSDNGQGVDTQKFEGKWEEEILKRGVSGSGSTGLGIADGPMRMGYFGGSLRAVANGTPETSPKQYCSISHPDVDFSDTPLDDLYGFAIPTDLVQEYELDKHSETLENYMYSMFLTLGVAADFISSPIKQSQGEQIGFLGILKFLQRIGRAQDILQGKNIGTIFSTCPEEKAKALLTHEVQDNIFKEFKTFMEEIKVTKLPLEKREAVKFIFRIPLAE